MSTFSEIFKKYHNKCIFLILTVIASFKLIDNDNLNRIFTRNDR